MASWREIERIRKDPVAFRALAARLSALAEAMVAELPDDAAEELVSSWVRDFLRDNSARRTKEFSTRQAEKLLEIRDSLEAHTTVAGFSVPILIRRCFELRLDLDERDSEWIAALHKSGRNYVNGREIGWLKRICKRLGEIEQYV